MLMTEEKRITMAHGAGGEIMSSLIEDEILPLFAKDIGEINLQHLDDSAVVENVVITIDGHTVKPIFFPGGDIGSLSVAGAINDILAVGALPVAICTALVIPEGFEMEGLKRILKSAAKVSDETGIPIIAGDTKVVGRDDLDVPIMTTSAIGRRHPLLDENLEIAGGRRTRWLTDNNLNDGDIIILTGTVGDHGVTILSEREGYGFQGDVKSDVAPLIDVMEAALNAKGVATAKDPTRGGLAETLNELSLKSDIGIEIHEENIPMKSWVSAASEMLGIDPLSIGNEGKFVMAVHPNRADGVLESIRKTENGKDAAVIGEVKKDIRGVVLKTSVGGRRILERPVGDLVPRIC